jgi:hypothetical protein
MAGCGSRGAEGGRLFFVEDSEIFRVVIRRVLSLSALDL